MFYNTTLLCGRHWNAPDPTHTNKWDGVQRRGCLA